MARLDPPEYFPCRLLIFNPDGTFTIRSFNDRVVRDREARMLPDGTPALAVASNPGLPTDPANGFFGFGLFYGRGTHLTVADYWRWFVVHIWVESIFEFFGVAAIAVLLVAMGLVTAKAALTIAYFTAAIVFLSGIIGTAHHYFWFGGPSYWLAWGTLFSSMEPIPLMGLVVRG